MSKWLLIEKSLSSIKIKKSMSGNFTEKIKDNIRQMIEKESLLM